MKKESLEGKINICESRIRKVPKRNCRPSAQNKNGRNNWIIKQNIPSVLMDKSWKRKNTPGLRCSSSNRLALAATGPTSVRVYASPGIARRALPLPLTPCDAAVASGKPCAIEAGAYILSSYGGRWVPTPASGVGSEGVGAGPCYQQAAGEREAGPLATRSGLGAEAV